MSETPGEGGGWSMGDDVVTLLDQVSRLVYGVGFAEGLFPAQWVALRYFHDSPETARTLSALARFQRIHLAPVSRTVSTLVDKGLLSRRPHPGFKRGLLFDLTDEGRALLNRDPLRLSLGPPIAGMAEDERAMLGRLMKRIIAHMQERAPAEGGAASPDTPTDTSSPV
ncbi:DNA-binding MarR family transcriptional regulator [Azospirillum agricola]|uniref:MarR family transcriptional regulator n=1 Tax=Azospirillum agricola TaxID=1720247 RepID=UPI001AE185EA|nr:MarR family transcriptional regulator [Azospirillum agricola]MBP2233077.1 DNA-binding MarR family transcriptional regulator [Azospirillum agricola]